MLVRDHFLKMVHICIRGKVWFSLFALPSISNFPGHLMGKKSIERLPDPPEMSSGHLTPPDVAGATEPDRYQGLLEALVLQQNHGNVVSRAADWLRGQRSGWREEERDKYLREVSLWLQHPLGSPVKIEGLIFFYSKPVFLLCRCPTSCSGLWRCKTVTPPESRMDLLRSARATVTRPHCVFFTSAKGIHWSTQWSEFFFFFKIIISKRLFAYDSPSGFQTIVCN